MGENFITEKKDKQMIGFLKKIDLKSLLIIALIIVILLMRMCDGSGEENKNIIKVDGKKYEVVKHTIDTVVIPVKQTVYKKGETIYKDSIIYVDVPQEVDTTQILKEFYSKVIYVDTLKLKDSLGFITIRDTITKNSILNRYFEANVNKITIKENLIVKELPVNQVYIGGTAGFDKTNIVNFVGPTIQLKTKKDKVYSLGIGYGLNNNVSVQLGMFWKISLKKKK